MIDLNIINNIVVYYHLHVIIVNISYAVLEKKEIQLLKFKFYYLNIIID